MEYILRKMKITTTELHVDIEDGDDMSPDELRMEVELLADLHGWDTNVTSHQTVLIGINESVVGSHRIGNWND